MNRNEVFNIIKEAITKNKILLITYQHVSDGEIVSHTIAPFDIGTTNPITFERNKDNVHAYCYDHKNNKDEFPDPKVIAFNINSFLSIKDTGKIFNPVELTKKHKVKTGYDYRNCKFAIMPERDWYR